MEGAGRQPRSSVWRSNSPQRKHAHLHFHRWNWKFGTCGPRFAALRPGHRSRATRLAIRTRFHFYIFGVVTGYPLLVFFRYTGLYTGLQDGPLVSRVAFLPLGDFLTNGAAVLSLRRGECLTNKFPPRVLGTITA